MASNADSAPSMRRSVRAAILVAIAIALSVILTLVAQLTHERILHNEHAWLQQKLDALVPPQSHDNDLLLDQIDLKPDVLGITQPLAIYRARKNGAPVAAILHMIAPDGYQGPIELLVAIQYDGTLLGVQVIRHRETPGIGDQFEHGRRDWLEAFRGRSLQDPPQQRWTVRADGGDFDAFTGATITPRAIVRGIRDALEYFGARRDFIFSASATPARSR